MYGVEDEFQLLRRLQSECGQEVQVLRIKVWARLLEEGKLGLGYLYVFKLWDELARHQAPDGKQPTRDLDLKPFESCAVELLVRCAVGETVGDRYIREELEYAALHS
jgi:hypothetical protein